MASLRDSWIAEGDGGFLPVSRMGTQRAPPDPLPYTGVCDESGSQWINHNGEKVSYYSFPFMEKLAQSRPPWCLLFKETRDSIITQLQQLLSRVSVRIKYIRRN